MSGDDFLPFASTKEANADRRAVHGPYNRTLYYGAILLKSGPG